MGNYWSSRALSGPTSHLLLEGTHHPELCVDVLCVLFDISHLH
jgi:hypothetical protein